MTPATDQQTVTKTFLAAMLVLQYVQSLIAVQILSQAFSIIVKVILLLSLVNSMKKWVIIVAQKKLSRHLKLSIVLILTQFVRDLFIELFVVPISLEWLKNVMVAKCNFVGSPGTVICGFSLTKPLSWSLSIFEGWCHLCHPQRSFHRCKIS